MGVVQGKTREQLRVAVAYNCGGSAFFVGATTSTVDSSSLIDAKLRGGDDEHNGKYVVATSGTNDGQISRVSDYDGAATDATVAPAFTATIPSGMTYELHPEAFAPSVIHQHLNDALTEATGLAFSAQESVALHSDGRTARFAIPAAFQILSKVEYRQRVQSTVIHAASSAWDESVDGDVTASQDTSDFKRGPGAFKLVVAAGTSAGDKLATQDIAALDLSGMDTVELWVKSTVATETGDLQLLLDNTALCASPLETLDVPALAADTWTYVRLPLANPELDTAIISVGLKYTVDIGACTLWLNDVRTVLDGSATWVTLDKHSWRVDQASRALVFTNGGRLAAGYSLLRLVGGSKPALLTADSDVCEVDDTFVIARATELTLLSASGGPQTDPDALRSLAGLWGGRAAEARRGMALLTNVRVVG